MQTLKDRLNVPSRPGSLRAVRRFVTDLLDQRDVPRPLANRIVLAVDEAVANIVEHAYAMDPSGRIEAEVELDGSRVLVALRHSGIPVDPDALPEPDILEHLRQGRRRGLGLFLIRRIMDDFCVLALPEGRSEVLLVKSLLPGPVSD